jgi:hypothetical protein
MLSAYRWTFLYRISLDLFRDTDAFPSANLPVSESRFIQVPLEGGLLFDLTERVAFFAIWITVYHK